MKYCIPGELWNQVGVPAHDLASTEVSTYISEMAYKLPSVTDVMMAKEFWHTVCEFAERCGALRERISGTVSSISPALGVGTPTFGRFQRLVGAGVNGIPVGFDKFVARDSASGVTVTFDPSCMPVAEQSYTAYLDVSAVPDEDAEPSAQVAPLWFLRKYDRALLAGTLMRLHAMAGRPWTDEAVARMHATTYLREVNRVTHGLITSGMRRQVLLDAESILARQSTTVNTTTNSNTVG